MWGKTYIRATAVIGIVSAVDADKLICDVAPVNGDAELLDVRLQAEVSTHALLVIPKVKSAVIVLQLDDSEAVVVACSQADKIVATVDDAHVEIEGGKVFVNGKDYKAVLGDILQQELNKELLRVSTIIQAINTAAPIPGDGGAAVVTALKTALAPLITPDYSSILSDKVKLS